MKKLATLIMVGCMTLAISFGFAACKDKACNHKYDNACDAVCNLCEEERAITHKPNADDNDCTTAVTCQNCSTVLTAAKTHDFETAQWQKDVDGHWHVCNNEDCNQTDIKAEHISDGAATETKPEKCTACGYEIAPMLEHTHAYGEATYEWNADYTICTATRVCSKDITHVEAENGVIASEITKQANCAEQGETTYTATFTNTAFATQTETVVNVATNDNHDYGTPIYEWNADYTQCTATRVCSRNSEHKEAENGVIASEITKQANCAEQGETTYTATFTNTAFATQTETAVNVETNDNHDYGAPIYEWNADYTQCTATRVCIRNSEHKETENATVASETTGDCGTGITHTYTATFTNTVFEQQVKTVTDTSAEHTYETAVVEWNADYSDCTVTRLCTVCNHTDSLTKTVKNESDGAKTVTACDE
ncbi:MAG: hypothetical protein IIX02_02175, partial [Clostridia bacterium]|nr:hypothetical protein [Clostridia bacterium]